MAKPKFIEKAGVKLQGLDYHFLKKKGIQHIQDLAGENWTDFNIHDPGVTILEQLSYALTELGYRSNLDFTDLLASQTNTEIDNTFFTVSQILPTNPVTANDFRKIIIDRVEGIRNIWIQPLNSFTRRKNIKGLYLAFIDVISKDEAEVQAVRKRTRSLLNYYSNLGETFEDVIVLKEQEIYIKCEIDLEKNVRAEAVHAEILFEIDQLISRPLMFYSLNEMLDRGHAVNSIFDGPRLMNGFIEDDFLMDKDNIFFNSQILNKIRDVEGIKTIKSFNLVVESDTRRGEKTYKDYVDILSGKEINEIVVIKWSSVAKLGQKIYGNANDPNFFQYTSDGIKINLFQKDVDRNLKSLDAKVKLRGSQNFKQENDFSVPTGNAKNIKQYYSIQHQFPNLYGLSKNGYSDKTGPERKGQIFQLKGYLLFFEQVLSNYLEQLSRFSELYGLDKSLDQSYFVQIPWDIPGIYELIRNVDENQPKEKFESSFQLAVEGIMKGIDNFYERRLQFVKHLLARFGDYSYQFSLSRFNYYSSPEESAKAELNSSLEILKNYFWLSSKKSRSFSHTSAFWEEDKTPEELKLNWHPNLSTLEARIRIKIGLPAKVKRIAIPLEKEVNFSPSNIAKKLGDYMHQDSAIHHTKMESSFESLWTYEHLHKHELEKDLIANIDIDEDLFKRGIWEENLSITKNPIANNFLVLFKKKTAVFLNSDVGKKLIESKFTTQIANYFNSEDNRKETHLLLHAENTPLYCFYFDKNSFEEEHIRPAQIWHVITSISDKEEAFKIAYSLRNNLLLKNQESEGFYLLDHVLLRPRSEELMVSILLNVPNSNWSFRLHASYAVDEVEDGIRKDIILIRKRSYHFERKNDKYIIVWKDGNQLIGRCNEKFTSKSKAEEAAKELQQFFTEFSDLDIHDAQRVKFKRDINAPPHPLNHYSFTITIFLSKWTARFSDPEFQYLLEGLFRKNTPAHIAIHFKWLALNDMATFENLYGLWLNENKKKQINYSFLNGLSNQLLSFAKLI